ncbi:MAG TPA: hypothetical protein PL070_10010 [Flavobacteriales bacterium]|nr:hypothetical protein [Flavobacteriales bacterium]
MSVEGLRLLGVSNGRKLFYLKGLVQDHWEDSLPGSTWVALPILDTADKDQADRIARACLDHKAVYVCTLGSSCEMLHDRIDDMNIMDTVNAELMGLSLENDSLPLMTTWHNDFDEGVWFALVAVDVSNTEVDTVVCIDMSEHGHAERLTSLAKAINNGWLPPE